YHVPLSEQGFATMLRPSVCLKDTFSEPPIKTSSACLPGGTCVYTDLPIIRQKQSPVDIIIQPDVEQLQSGLCHFMGGPARSGGCCLRRFLLGLPPLGAIIVKIVDVLQHGGRDFPSIFIY